MKAVKVQCPTTCGHCVGVIARRIVKALFTSAFEASPIDRLVLMSGTRDLGGWSQIGATGKIAEVLQAEFKAIARAELPKKRRVKG